MQFSIKACINKDQFKNLKGNMLFNKCFKVKEESNNVVNNIITILFIIASFIYML